MVLAPTPLLSLLFAVALMLSGACSRDRADAAPESKPAARALPQRIVSLTPSTTEAVFAVGAGKLLVGRSKFCDYPAEATKLPSVGGYIDPSLEVVLSLQPDLVVGARGPSGRAMADRLGEQGIDTFFPPTDSRADIEAMLRKLGAKLGRKDEAESVISGINAQVDRVARRLAVEGAELPRVLLVFGTKPIVIAGPGSFAGEVLTLAGAKNAMQEGAPYPKIGMETLLDLDPDTILDATMAASQVGVGIHRDAPGWRELRAVREGRLLPIRDEAVLRPGPRVGDGLITIAQTLHPSVDFTKTDDLKPVPEAAANSKPEPETTEHRPSP